MISINFEHISEPIKLETTKCNILVVEENKIYSKIMYSLYNTEDTYFKMFDDKFNNIKDSEMVTIFNPLSFDFDERNIKTILHNLLIQEMNNEINKKQEIEAEYKRLINKLIDALGSSNDLDLIYNDTLNYKDIFKMIRLSLNQEVQTSIFEKVQLLINTLNELVPEKVLVFTHLNILLTNSEYKSIIEQIDLNNQTVLIFESSEYTLEGIEYYYLDKDFFLTRNVV